MWWQIKMFKFKYLLIVLLVLSLQACMGFHLRGSDVDGGIKLNYPIYLGGVSLTHPFGRAMNDNFKRAGATLRGNRSNTDYDIHITDYKEERHIAGYTADRQVREYAITLKMNYRIVDAKTKKEISDSIDLSRTQVYDNNQTLGMAEEEETIRFQQRNDAARVIRNRMRYLVQSTTPVAQAETTTTDNKTQK